jgi:hypothetical protein
MYISVDVFRSISPGLASRARSSIHFSISEKAQSRGRLIQHSQNIQKTIDHQISFSFVCSDRLSISAPLSPSDSLAWSPKLISSILDSSSQNAETQAENLPFSPNLAQSLLLLFSLSQFLTKVDQTRPFPVSNRNAANGLIGSSPLRDSLGSREQFARSDCCGPSRKIFSSLHHLFSADAQSQNVLANSGTISQTENLPFSPNLAVSLLFSFSFSISKPLSPFLTNADQANAFPVSHRNGSSLVLVSRPINLNIWS